MLMLMDMEEEDGYNDERVFFLVESLLVCMRSRVLFVRRGRVVGRRGENILSDEEDNWILLNNEVGFSLVDELGGYRLRINGVLFVDEVNDLNFNDEELC